MITKWRIYHKGVFVKEFMASGKADAYRECRQMERDFKLPLHSLKLSERKDEPAQPTP